MRNIGLVSAVYALAVLSLSAQFISDDHLIDIQKAVAQSDEMIWLTPSRKNQREYLMVTVHDQQVKSGLKKCFSIFSKANNVDRYLLDTNSKDDGYIVFKSGGEIVLVLQIDSRESNKKAVRYCDLVMLEDNIVVLSRPGTLLDALVCEGDFRTILKDINLDNNSLVKIFIIRNVVHSNILKLQKN